MLFNGIRGVDHPTAARAARRAVDVLHGKVADPCDQACARMLNGPIWRQQSALVRATYAFAFSYHWWELDQAAAT